MNAVRSPKDIAIDCWLAGMIEAEARETIKRVRGQLFVYATDAEIVSEQYSRLNLVSLSLPSAHGDRSQERERDKARKR